jgi:hypothetical protein
VPTTAGRDAGGRAAAGQLPEVQALEVILGIQPRRYFSRMEAGDDYSFLDTPLLNESDAGGSGGNGSARAGGGADGSRRLHQLGPLASQPGDAALRGAAAARRSRGLAAARQLLQASEPFAEAPEQNSSSGTLVRRRRLLNPNMPAYIADRLAWGSPPTASSRSAPPAAAGGQGEPGSGGGSSSSSTTGEQLPPGSYCAPAADGGEVCGVSMVYCCLGE